jgi:hypothetical protein
VSAAPLPEPLTPSVTVAESFETVVVTPDRAPSAGGDATPGPADASALASDATPVADEAALVSEALLGYRWTADRADAPLGFDSCDPRVQGDAATAVCHAGAGVWNVSLRKAGAAWKVETARAER